LLQKKWLYNFIVSLKIEFKEIPQNTEFHSYTKIEQIKNYLQTYT